MAEARRAVGGLVARRRPRPPAPAGRTSRMARLVVDDQHPVRPASGADRPAGGRGPASAGGRQGGAPQLHRRSRPEERQQRLHDRLRRRVPVLRARRAIIRRDDGVQLGRQVRRRRPAATAAAASSRRIRISTGVAVERERQLAGQAPVQRAAQAVDVGADVHRAGVAGLLRGHVVDRAQHRARLRSAASADVPRTGRSRAAWPGPRGVTQDVRRLDVAVDQAVLVRLGQGAGDLVGDRCTPGPAAAARGRGRSSSRSWPGTYSMTRYRSTGSSGSALTARPASMAADDVRVPQPGDGPHLGEEARLQGRVVLVASAAAP